MDIARRYGVVTPDRQGQSGVSRWTPGEGTRLCCRPVISCRMRHGRHRAEHLEMRLYYYPTRRRAETVVITHPVSIGGWIGRRHWVKTSVIDKRKDPPGITGLGQAEHARRRRTAGHDTAGDPRIRWSLRLISGIPAIGSMVPTNANPSASYAGHPRCVRCIRKYRAVVQHCAAGTPVHIVDQPVKAGWLADTLFLEVHAPLEEDELPLNVSVESAVKVAKAKARPETAIDMQAIELIVSRVVASRCRLPER